MDINSASSSTVPVALTPSPPPTFAFFDHVPSSPPPAGSSPLRGRSSSLSILASPLKRKPGRPTNRRNEVRARKTLSPNAFKTYQEKQTELRSKQRAIVYARELAEQAAREEAREARLQHETKNRNQDVKSRAQAAINDLKHKHGFESLWDFIRTVLGSNDQQLSAHASRLVKAHSTELLDLIASRDGDGLNRYMAARYGAMLSSEVDRLVKIQRRPELTTVGTLLDSFSMISLRSIMANEAPMLWSLLSDIVFPRDKQELLESGQVGRQNHGLVVTTICAMLSFAPNQKSNNFQTVMGLFLLGCGAKKGLIEVLAHTGMTVSYPTIMNHIRQLSAERSKIIRQLVRECTCMIVWDNVNIAFRVAEQRLVSKDHFDNGTTATIIPLYNPRTHDRVPLGTLSMSMKPKRMGRYLFPELNTSILLPSPPHEQELHDACLWQLKHIAVASIPGFEHLKEQLGPPPSILPIPLHKTEQYPLPAMEIDESSLEGTLKVLETIFFQTLQLDEETMQKHGLFFVDGDLLTMMLTEKIEAARRDDVHWKEHFQFTIRRFGLFHAKMAACKLVLNQHWGKPNTKWAGCLWKENMVLGRKPISAGWKAKKSPPWRSSHELIQLSTSAHVYDAFRLVTNSSSFEDLNKLAKTMTLERFEELSSEVLHNFFSSWAYSNARSSMVPRDHTFENNLLYNRDALLYVEFCSAIKMGDIGRVLNVLRVYMIMMRGENHMPKYADTIFETLCRLDTYPDELRELFLHNWLVNTSGKPNAWKEVDLLQEHQNFWAKVIYSAKGVNKSWEWLSMISVCIYVLRDAMETVQEVFNTNQHGKRHSKPQSDDDIHILAGHLAEENVQMYSPFRPGREEIDPVVDLLEAGSNYPTQPNAFAKIIRDPRRGRHATNSEHVEAHPQADIEPPDPADLFEATDEFNLNSGELEEWADDLVQAAIELCQNLGL